MCDPHFFFKKSQIKITHFFSSYMDSFFKRINQNNLYDAGKNVKFLSVIKKKKCLSYMYVHSVLSSTNLFYSAVQLQLQITICGKAKNEFSFSKRKGDLIRFWLVVFPWFSEISARKRLMISFLLFFSFFLFVIFQVVFVLFIISRAQ